MSVEGIDGDPSGESIRAVLAAEHSTIFASVLQELYPSLKSFESVDLSFVFVSSEYMKNLNLQYRELDEPTDVLSFPLWEVDGAFRPTWSGPDLPLGDVVICEEIVRESADEQGILFLDAMCLILSHGVLHLIGFDHYSEEDRVRMFELQETMRDGLVSFSRNNTGHAS